MKAFLLAAGYGTRLRPITDTLPKCLVPICDKPLLWWWFKLLEKHGVNEVLLNTHYLRNMVVDFIKTYNNSNDKLEICEFYEAELLGSGGTVFANKQFVDSEESFIICYADNLTNINITEMLSVHKSHEAILTMALFHTNNPKQCGIAQLDYNKKIIDFVEKPENPEGDLANAGIYIVRKDIFDIISLTDFRDDIDLGKDILPLLVNNMYGYEMKDYLLDIGTLENYKKAQGEWSK